LIRKEVKWFKESFEENTNGGGGGGVSGGASELQGVASASSFKTGITGSSSSTNIGVVGSGSGSNNNSSSAVSSASSTEAVQMAAAEVRLCERKLQILRARRHDEHDAKVIAMRRATRAEALQAQQAKDPNNFGRQEGR